MFKIENWGSDTSNIKNSLGGPSYFRYYNQENNDVTTAGYFPDNLRLKEGDRIVVIPQDTDAADELYVVTDITAGTPTVAKATGGSSLPDQTGHSGEFLTTDGTDASWGAVSEVPSTTGATEGDVLTVDGTGNAVWQAGGSGLPDQTGQSGKFLTTDGTDASWSDKPLVNLATGANSLAILGTATGGNSVSVGNSATATYNFSVTVGMLAGVAANRGIAIGYGATANSTGAYNAVAIGAYNTRATANHSIQLGCTDDAMTTNSDANTFKVANGNGNFEIMSADGTIPAARHASLPATDGTYVLKLVIASGVPTLSWVAE